MRIWSIHPKYLDTQGLVALWCETLLAKKVLENKTRGYKNHPQLERFKKSDDAISAINMYLTEVFNETVKRAYNFNKLKIGSIRKNLNITVTSGQLEFEIKHLEKKLNDRESKKYLELKTITNIEPHPIFKVIEGDVEDWERTEQRLFG
ncbi:MAG: hypothetical protein HY958_05200 [Bacteroidia bacterium]|nr:hypothetical protein [Bacteroidia bacterium]